MRQQNRLINDPTTLLPPAYIASIVDRSERFEGHPVFEDLADHWIALKELEQRAIDIDGPPLEALLRAIDRLSGPMEFVLRRFGRRSIRRSRARPRILDGICDEKGAE